MRTSMSGRALLAPSRKPPMLATMFGSPSSPATAPILPLLLMRAARAPARYANCSLARSSEITFLPWPPEQERDLARSRQRADHVLALAARAGADDEERLLELR